MKDVRGEARSGRDVRDVRDPRYERYKRDERNMRRGGEESRGSARVGRSLNVSFITEASDNDRESESARAS